MKKIWPQYLTLLYVLITCILALSSACKKSAEANTAAKPLSPTVQDPAYSRELIESKESAYNNIYMYRSGPYVNLTFGYNDKIFNESTCNTTDITDLPYPYTRFMTASLLYPAEVKSVLEIGSGVGTTARYLHNYLPDARITTVELDPAVVEMAHKYCGLQEARNLHVIARDGRMFLADSPEHYDLILLDAYRGPFVPFHLVTKEFYQVAKQHLTETGVLAMNIEPQTMLFDSAVNTIRELFPNIEFYDASGTDKGGNVVLIAYAGASRNFPDLAETAQKRKQDYKLRYDLSQMLEHRYLLKEVWDGNKRTLDVANQSGTSTAGIDENAKVLTDDFAPVDSLRAIKRHNEKWKGTQQ
jgi:spermidine synthase